MIRWKGVIALAVLAGLFIVLSLIFTDRWLEHRLEDAGSAMVGAKVEIDGLDFSFTKARLQWNRLQVTNPKNTMRNLFETGKCDLNLEFWPLLSKKIIIENFEISGFKPNTPRTTDGKLPKKPKTKSKTSLYLQKLAGKLEHNVEQSTGIPISGFNKKINTDSLLKILKLQTPHKIDSLKKAIDASYTHWQQRLKKLKLDDDIKVVSQQIQTIHPEKIKTITQLQKTLKTLESIRKKLKAVSDSLKETKTDLSKDLAELQQSARLVRQWIQEDYRHTLALAKIPELSKENIARMLFGPTLVNRITQYLGYIRTARYYAAKLKSNQPKKEHPPRFKGQDIYFYSPNARPDWWIKQIKLSGQTTDGLQLAGVIKDIVSDQRFIHRPTTIDIKGSAKDGRSFGLQGILNYLKDVPQESFEVHYFNFPLKNVRIADSPYLPQKLQSGTGRLQASLMLNGEQIKSTIKFVVTRIAFESSKKLRARNVVQSLIDDVLHKIQTLTLQANIMGTADHLKFNVNSNLDDLLMREFKTRLSAEVNRAKQRIHSEIEKRTSRLRKDFETFAAQKQQALQKEIDRYQQLLDRQKEALKKRQKEIEQRIAKEKSKKTKEVQQKLKSLFK